MKVKERFALNKRIAWVVIFIILLMCESLLEASEPAKELDAQVVSTQIIEPIIEYKPSKGEVSVDIIFDVATMTVKEAKGLNIKEPEKIKQMKDNEKIKIYYPKVIFILDEVYPVEKFVREIHFCDPKMNRKKKIYIANTERVITSNNGKYILIAREPDEDYPEIQGGILYNNAGVEIWRKDKGPSPVVVSDEGYVIAKYPGYGEEPPGDFVLYDPEGKELKKIKNPLSYLPVGWSLAKFSEDGKYAVLNFSDGNSKSVIITIDKEGNLIGQKEYDYSVMVYEVGGKNILTTFYKMLMLKPPYYYEIHIGCLNEKGDLNWKKPLEIGGITQIKLSFDRSKVFVISAAGYFWCFDIHSGNLLWKHKEPWAPTMESKRWPDDVPRFYELKNIRDEAWILGKSRGQKREWISSTIFIFNSNNGKIIDRIEYPNRRISLILQDNNIFILDIDSKNILLINRKK